MLKFRKTQKNYDPCSCQDFNEYAAMLLTAEEEIKRKFETRRRSPATSIEFDLRRIERPKLTSNLFLLVLDVSGPPNTPNSGQDTSFHFWESFVLNTFLKVLIEILGYIGKTKS